MKSLKESILSTTKSGKRAMTRILVDKLSDRMFERRRGEDIIGQKLEVGDVVIDTDNFNFWCVREIDGNDVCVFERNGEEAAEIIFSADNLFKLNDPEKYIK